MAIFINGKVITMNNKNEICNAFCIRNGVFEKVGNKDEVLSVREGKEEIIDLEGNTVVPGFNDAHMHFLNYAVTKDRVNLRSAKSIEEIINRTKAYIYERKVEKGKWILSRGWDENKLEEGRLLNRRDLDNISKDHPIVFSRICGHIGVVNSKALEMLNISKDTLIDGGVIDLDEAGCPTGVLRENALNLVFENMPPMDKEDIKKVLKNSFKDAVKVGLTSIQTDDISHAGSTENVLEAYKELREEGLIPLRVTLQLYLPTIEKIEKAISAGVKDFKNDERVKSGCIKFYQDGSLGGRTAAMERQYKDTLDTGVAVYSQESLNKLVCYANKEGFNVAVHAIGDRAVRMVLNAYEKSKDYNRRNAVVHCQFTNEAILNKFRELKVIANVQPVFVSSDYKVVEKAVDKTTARESYAWKSMLSKGIDIAFSTDAPIESFNPMENMYSAVTRMDLKGEPKGGWNVKEKLSVLDALKCYTLGSAYMSEEENIKGSIEEGKLGDFVVISEDILTIKEDKIKDIKVIRTYVGGIEEYKR